jgi:hypothetical protein
MADLYHVEEALAGLISDTLYPDGTDSPSLVEVPCRIYRGWPNATALNADLSAGRVNVTVFPDGAPGRVTSRFAPAWPVTTETPSLTMVVDGASVTVAGIAEVGQRAALLIDRKAYLYEIQPGDTPALVAANLAQLARADRVVQLSQARITIPDAQSVSARVVTTSAVMQEVRRQEKDMRVSCWCPSPSIRDTIADTVDRALARRSFLRLADGTEAKIGYSATSVFDQSQNALLYRRDLVYTVEYPTTIVEMQPRMLLGSLKLNAGHYIA